MSERRHWLIALGDKSALGTKKRWSAETFHPLIWCLPAFAGPEFIAEDTPHSKSLEAPGDI
jgi:hypothetical protein